MGLHVPWWRPATATGSMCPYALSGRFPHGGWECGTRAACPLEDVATGFRVIWTISVDNDSWWILLGWWSMTFDQYIATNGQKPQSLRHCSREWWFNFCLCVGGSSTTWWEPAITSQWDTGYKLQHDTGYYNIGIMLLDTGSGPRFQSHTAINHHFEPKIRLYYMGEVHVINPPYLTANHCLNHAIHRSR